MFASYFYPYNHDHSVFEFVLLFIAVIFAVFAMQFFEYKLGWSRRKAEAVTGLCIVGLVAVTVVIAIFFLI